MSDWESIEPHLGFAIGLLSNRVSALVQTILSEDEEAQRQSEAFLNKARAKYQRGNAEHNDAWVDWNDERFVQECEDEILDAVIYLAMMRSRKASA